MKLSEARYDNRETGCCARFDPGAWSEREVTWRDFGGAVTRANAAIEAAEAYPGDPLTLSRHVSPWRTDLYVMADRAVPGAEVEGVRGGARSRYPLR